MDPASSFQPPIFSTEELPGILEVPDHPELTAGYADIYHGVWKGQGGIQIGVAIKQFRQLVPKDKRTDLAALKEKTDKRMKREVIVWSRISHPNLHPLLGYRSQPRPRLISPWCRHGNLKDYLHDNPGLSRLQKLRLVHQVACGLHHLHSQIPPICHADIKPQNVLINDVLEAALCDFGLSRVLQELREPGELTTSETVKGTLNYMAVELFAGGKPNLETDVYAFGGLTLAAMSGKGPFFGLHETTVILRVMQDQPPTPEDHPDLPPSDPLWDLMRVCWDKNAAARPTMQEVLGKLLEYIDYEQSNPSQLHGLLPILDDGGSTDMDLDTPRPTPKGGILALPPPDPVLADDSLRTANGQGACDSVAGVVLATRRSFKSLEVQSKVIPVIGGYMAAIAEIGLALIEMIELGSTEFSSITLSLAPGRQASDRDKCVPSGLLSNMRELTLLLELLYKRSSAPQAGEISSCIMNIQRELQFVREKIEQRRPSGMLLSTLSPCDRVEESERYQIMVEKVLEEIHLLVNANPADLATELINPEIPEQQRRLMELLGDGKYGAQGNTIEDVICFPGTRVEILKRIDHWIRDTSTLDRVLWIRGMAGRGKSTIVSTVAHNWRYRASCATFHFRRGQSTLNTSIIYALTRQLASSLVPDVRKAVLKSVQENEDIGHQRLDEQFKTLLVASLANLNNQTHPILIAVDALDECDNIRDAVAFVKLIDQHSPSLPTNVKFLLTCRPEASLLRILEPRKWHIEDLDSSSDVSDDIARFIRQTCTQIRDDHDLPEHWPSSKDVVRLVQMSEGLFQWARTVTMYLSNGSPVDRLRGLLQRPSMWSGLDDLYHQILLRAFGTVELDAMRQDLLCSMLGTLVVAPYPISLEIIAALYGDNEVFNGMDQADIIRFLRKDILADLNSLLLIPASPAGCVRLMHTSISDLLVSKQRCEYRPYYIDTVWQHQQLANSCLSIMLRQLKENICNLSDLSKASSEVRDVAEREVSMTVRYCCRAWSVHLTEGVKWTKSSMDVSALEIVNFNLFSREKVMCWLEVMSLVGATTEAIIMAKRAHQWLLRCPSEISEMDSLVQLWKDVQRFITTFSEPISFGPLHIYASALPHCPVETELWKCYQTSATVRTVRGCQMSTWPPNIWTRFANAAVKSVAFSPDSTLIASGHADGGIQLWNAETGTPYNELLTDHHDQIFCVCFSPNGKVLASASNDRTIRLWDTQTGVAICDPLTGHSEGVYSMCFSPNGEVLVSGSSDATIRLWDAQTGRALGDQVMGADRAWENCYSVCFSPDGKVLASVSSWESIHLWDTQTLRMIGKTFEPNAWGACSICFSPDGKVIALGSDWKIQLWDTRTGRAIGKPLQSRCSRINSVCISPDGKLLASGEGDRYDRESAIQLWDIQTGSVIDRHLTGHGSRIKSVCFSPDGKVLASGSEDRTIRLWDIQAGTGVGEPPTDRDKRFMSMSVSPNGKTLASGSFDGAIQLWDSHTGNAVTIGHSPQVGFRSASVPFVCFSPDGKALVSVYHDKIRLWDGQTGEALSRNINGIIGPVCFSPDSKILAAVTKHNSIQYLDPKTGKAIGVPRRAHKGKPVRAVCFSPDGKVLASLSNESLYQDAGTIRFEDAQTRNVFGEPIEVHDYSVKTISFSPDGMSIMAYPRSGEPIAWDTLTVQRHHTPRGIPCHAKLYSKDHWIKYSSSRLFWLPPQYWSYDCYEIVRCDGTIAILYGDNILILDVSRALAR